MRTAVQPYSAPFLIIAGVSKAGTTSLFHYFAGHPGICRACFKEPFMLPGMTFPCIDSTPGSLEAYLSCFKDCRAGETRLEASTAYFSTAQTPARIREALPNARVVISLRDPVERLVSWYKFARFNERLPRHLSFEAYVDKMLQPDITSKRANIYEQPLREGLYAKHLRAWLDVFGPERLLVVTFDDIATTAPAVARRVAEFARLDPSYFDDFQFKRENPSREYRGHFARAAYATLRSRLRTALAPGSPLRPLARTLDRAASNALRQLTVRPARPVHVPPHVHARLQSYYRKDVLAVPALIGITPTWTARYA